jgi:hypothetical protein
MQWWLLSSEKRVFAGDQQSISSLDKHMRCDKEENDGNDSGKVSLVPMLSKVQEKRFLKLCFCCFFYQQFCRFGAGVELKKDKGDTPGFDLQVFPTVEVET